MEFTSEIVTYWEKCTFNGYTEPPWTLQYVEGKGYIAISTRSFEQGDLILTEKPLTWTLGWHPFTTEQIDNIYKEVELLSEGR
jgi:hypothetical protein